MESVVYSNRDIFEIKVASLRRGGAARLQCIADFDFTLTKFWSPHPKSSDTNNPFSPKRLLSCHKVLEECGLLSEEYHDRAQAFQKKYYPLEVSPTLDMDSKIRFMLEWVTQAHDLLISAGLTADIIRSASVSACDRGELLLRAGAVDLLKRLDAAAVPVLVMSAGLGDVIDVVLDKYAPPTASRRVISNRCRFLDNRLVGFHEPLLHVFNKRVVDYKESHEYFKLPGLDSRSSILLLGDSLGDAHMSDGLSSDCALKIGFLNDSLDRLSEYLVAYDVVIMGDGGLDFVIDLVEKIFSADSSI